MYDQAAAPVGWISLQSEGFAGYYVALNQAGTEYAFAVANITTWPTVGSTYNNSGSIFTITFAPISGSYGTIFATSNSGDPAISGTLTNLTGTGDASVAFSAWQSQAVTLNSVNPSTHTHTFDIPTGTAAGTLAQSDSGTNCPAFGHDHVIIGELASTNMDTNNTNPWEVPNIGLNFIKLVGPTVSWDGVARNVYCLFAGQEAMTNGWADVTATYTGLYLKIAGTSTVNTAGVTIPVSTLPVTLANAQNEAHTHIAGTFTTSFESAEWGNNGYRATCYAAPHDHLVTLSTSSSNAGNPPSVSFRLGYKILGQMNPWNGAITSTYTSGLYVSSPQQINAQSLDKLYWNQSISGVNDTITFYVRTAATQAALSSATWNGPYTNPNGSDLSMVTANVWFQYEIIFVAADTTAANPSVYFSNGYTVQYTYFQGGYKC